MQVERPVTLSKKGSWEDPDPGPALQPHIMAGKERLKNQRLSRDARKITGDHVV
jgi:hypothetical protein